MHINEAQAFFYHLAHVLEHFEGNAVNVVVVCDVHWLSTHGGPQRNKHSHKEAYVLIPPHVLLSIQESVIQEEHVWSPDKHKCLNSAHGLGVTRLSQWHDNVHSLNSLWPIDVVWWQGSRSTLAQVMDCCLTAPSHYLNQFWLIISKVWWH